MGWGIFLTILLALVGPLYQLMLKTLRALSAVPLALFWGGATVGLLSCKQTMVWGNGDVALTTMLSGKVGIEGIATVLFLRLLATTVCVGVGTVGGVFTPTLFTGAAIGLAVGTALLFWAWAFCWQQ